MFLLGRVVGIILIKKFTFNFAGFVTNSYRIITIHIVYDKTYKSIYVVRKNLT